MAPKRPKKKTGPPKGTRIGGRARGTKNKVTLEREATARAEMAAQIRKEQEESAQRLAAAGVASPEAAREIVERTPDKLMKEIAFDFAKLFAGMAAFYQPFPQWSRDGSGKLKNANPNYDERLFREYAVLAKDTALGAAAYQSPKLSAVMVGQQIVNHVEVTGGMPDEFEPPTVGTAVEFQPGDIVSAEDGIADSKVVAGEIVPMPPKKASG